MSALAIAIDVLLVLVLVLAFSNSGRLLGPRPRHEGDADLPFETGERPIEPAIAHMSVLYYRFAVLFVVFDVDLAFLLPWALNRGSLTLAAMVSVTVFAGLVAFMLAYFWRRGALECR
jgi:NADH:ubiquinone oxidoreductase subunit 3 (subunit A)